MTKINQQWTGNLTPDQQGNFLIILEQLCMAFNSSPFYQHNRMSMRVIDQKIQAYIEMQPHLIGNVAFQILHGGVAATILDSLGGISAMAELYRLSKPNEFAEMVRKVTRLATLDMRIDYIAPGRGQYFIADAEIVRMGKKSCLTRMHLINDENILIATAIASYSY